MTYAQLRAVLGKPLRVRREERFRAARYIEYTRGRDHGWTVGVYRGAFEPLAAAEVITVGIAWRSGFSARPNGRHRGCRRPDAPGIRPARPAFP